jgi:hypothetical protein
MYYETLMTGTAKTARLFLFSISESAMYIEHSAFKKTASGRFFYVLLD